MRITALRVLRWWLPWACVLAASTVLASGLDQGLQRVLGPLDGPAAPDGVSYGAPLRSIQIVLLHPDRPSTILECMAKSDKAAADVLEFWEASEVQQVITNVCVTDVVYVDPRGGPS